MPKKKLEIVGDRHPNKRAHAGNPDRCGATTRADYNGKPAGRACEQPAGWGTPNTSGPCRLHGGGSSFMERNAEKKDAQKAAERELKKLDLWGSRRDDLTPAEALADELSRTAGRVQALEQHLCSLGDEDSPRARGLAAELTAERGQYLRVAEAAERAGVTVKQLEKELEWGQKIATVVGGFLRDFDLTPAQQATVQALLTWHLRGCVGDKPPRPAEVDLPHYEQPSSRLALPAGATPLSAAASREAAPGRCTEAELPLPGQAGPGERQELVDKLRSIVERSNPTER